MANKINSFHVTHRLFRVRTDKANFGPLPIGLIFSVKVTIVSIVQISHLFQSMRFSHFFETIFKMTSKLANLPLHTLKFLSSLQAICEFVRSIHCYINIQLAKFIT